MESRKNKKRKKNKNLEFYISTGTPQKVIERILKPLDCKALKAVSRPAPGPFNLTVKIFKPCS